jgi:hypothetical protein
MLLWFWYFQKMRPRLTRTGSRAALVAGMLWLSGCAGGSLSKISNDGTLPQELSKDYQQKFEVKEVDLAPVVTSPQKIEQNTKKVPRKKKAAIVPVSENKVLQEDQVPVTPFKYPVRRPEKDPTWLSEKQVFEITYFGVTAGDFTLDVLPFKMISNRKVYHIKGTAVSSKLFGLFYRLNDSVETFIDYDGIFPHRFHVLLDETKQTRDSLELYDAEKSRSFFWNRWNHKVKGYIEIKDFFPMQPFSQDSLSALYYLRTLPLPTGAVISFPVISEGKNWEAVITVLRREVLDTPIGKVQTIVLKPETKYQGILQKRGDSFVWLTDDDRRYLIRLEAKVKIGAVVANLKKVEPGISPSQ